MKLRLIFLLLTGMLVLGACVAPPTASPLILSTEPPTESGLIASPLGTSTPTATIVWFPPEATQTPFPTPVNAPTLNPLPGRGVQTFADDFSDPSLWQSAKTQASGGNDIIISRNRLTIAINVTPAYVFSLNRQLLLRDFYAEVTVDLNRCSVGDTYGMLFRALGNEDSYRYTLGCNGQVRVERLKSNIVSPLQNWLPSGDAPVAAPDQVTLGIWASGVEMRFFLNGHYQFSLVDPVFRFGTLGLFATSNNTNGVNISFRDLVVHEVGYVSPTPTATSSKTPTSTRTPRP
jgi:hypothetical protein